jgi:hypothetical protein
LETTVGDCSNSVPTLAEQARLLKPDSYRSDSPPGHTPSLARIGKPRIVATAHSSPHTPPAALSTADASQQAPAIDRAPVAGDNEMDLDIDAGEALRPAPAPNLRDTSRRDQLAASAKFTADVVHLPELEPRPPVFLPPEQERKVVASSPPGNQLNTTAIDDDNSEEGTGSVVDLDSAPASTLAPVVQRAEAVFERLLREDPMFKRAGAPKHEASDEDNDQSSARPFSNSLQTSEEFNDS